MPLTTCAGEVKGAVDAETHLVLPREEPSLSQQPQVSGSEAGSQVVATWSSAGIGAEL